MIYIVKIQHVFILWETFYLTYRFSQVISWTNGGSIVCVRAYVCVRVSVRETQAQYVEEINAEWVCVWRFEH